MNDQEMARFIAENVLGWKSRDVNTIFGTTWTWINPDNRYMEFGRFDPANKPTQAIMVLEDIEDQLCNCVIHFSPIKVVELCVRYVDEHGTQGYNTIGKDPKVARAICKALVNIRPTILSQMLFIRESEND